MKIKVSDPVLEYDGKKIYSDPPANKKVFTIREAIVNAINSTKPSESVVAEDKEQIYNISTKLYKGNEVDLSVKELAFIKEKAFQVSMPLVYGRICEVVDPAGDK